MDEKFQQIMDAIQSSKCEMQEELLSKLEKLQKEVTSSQDSASQEVVKKLKSAPTSFEEKAMRSSLNSTQWWRSTWER